LSEVVHEISPEDFNAYIYLTFLLGSVSSFSFIKSFLALCGQDNF
jgi:hypothetical protein